jgi:hypothetical protein
VKVSFIRKLFFTLPRRRWFFVVVTAFPVLIVIAAWIDGTLRMSGGHKGLTQHYGFWTIFVTTPLINMPARWTVLGRISEEDPNRSDLSLKQTFPITNPAAKLSMSKTVQGFRFAAQIHPANGSADGNITVGSFHYLAFAKLHERRNDIHGQFRKNLEWKLNDSGESWVLVRNGFSTVES